MLIFQLNISAHDVGVPSHQAITSLLSHTAAVDRRAFPGAHRMTPFAANSALCRKGSSVHAPSLFELRFEPVSKVLRHSTYCQEANLLSIVFFVVAVGRGASFGDKEWQ